MPELHIGVVIHGCADVSIPCIENVVKCNYDEPPAFHFLSNGSPPPDGEQIYAAISDIVARPHLIGSVQGMVSDENMGCARGWNTIIEQAQCDPLWKYVVLVGHDVFPHMDAIRNLVKRYERGDVDMVTGVPYEQSWEFTPRDEEAPGPDFSFILLPRKIIEAVGTFDPNFWPAYFEDNDYHHRTKLAGCGFGIRTFLAPFHHRRSSTLRRYPHLGQFFNTNRDYFVKKWGGTPDVVGANLPWRGVDTPEKAEEDGDTVHT